MICGTRSAFRQKYAEYSDQGSQESNFLEHVPSSVQDAADKFRKRLGKYNPKWGDGTLTEGIRQNNAPAPFPNTTITSQGHMRALALVSSALSVKGANQTRAPQS